jgi:phytoene desaturase
MSRIFVAGAGFSGLSTAACLAAAGHEVHVYEKNASAGGRARQLQTPEGYTFDMGPSWYWMPDVFERFFQRFGYTPSDFYSLDLLDPAFEVVFANTTLKVPGHFSALPPLFDAIEAGAGNALLKFMREAKFKYEVGMHNLVYKPGLSIREFVDVRLLKGMARLQVFTSLGKHVRHYFRDPRLIALMEFPVLFLGAMPQNTPALYSLMNYAGLNLGTWYPAGGFGTVVTAMQKVAEAQGAIFHFSAPIERINVRHDKVESVIVNGQPLACDAVVGTADYHHMESLLAPEFRNYREDYWQKKTFAPSCLIYYIGVRKRIDKLLHHTLFFEEDLTQHAVDIYQNPRWPSRPLFYVCCPSRSDATVAPPGHENLFLLMPVAPGLEDHPSVREKYFAAMLGRLERHAGQTILPDVDYKKSYCISDFITDYHAYEGNAYGLANTLTQTALLKPKVINRKIKNLFYAGQLTVPGPGVPPAIISGQVAADVLMRELPKIS